MSTAWSIGKTNRCKNNFFLQFIFY